MHHVPPLSPCKVIALILLLDGTQLFPAPSSPTETTDMWLIFKSMKIQWIPHVQYGIGFLDINLDINCCPYSARRYLEL